MGKITVYTCGTVQVKMDTKDDTYYDAKDPHVSFYKHGREVYNHIYLNDVDRLVATGDTDMQEAIRYVRRHKGDLEQQYYDNNR